jgi:NAD(P)-dependent dehydrogenase (short-subunit alcohol dehydrogenase family)
MKNLKVLITGGTSGLGKALTSLLREQGAQVVTFARHSTSDIDFTADVANKNDIHRIAALTAAKLGSVDVIINNASALGPTPLKLLLDTECEDFESVLQTNLLGPFRLIKALVPSMITQKRGLIINISSDAAVNGYPGWGAYAASKAALDQLTRVLNAELLEYGIKSVSIDPGDMNTPMHLAAIPNADPKQLKDPQTSAQQIVELIRSNQFTESRLRL